VKILNKCSLNILVYNIFFLFFLHEIEIEINTTDRFKTLLRLLLIKLKVLSVC